jgi:hypothetical protein
MRRIFIPDQSIYEEPRQSLGFFISTHNQKGDLMKIRSVLTVALLLSFALAGCNDDDDKQQPKQQQFTEINRLNRELQKAETNVSKQESAKAWWQSIATAFAVAAISLLVVGTIIGSSARHESQR